MAQVSRSQNTLLDEPGWAELIERVARDDETALSQLYDDTSRVVYSLILRIVQDPMAAGHSVQAIPQQRRTVGGR